MDELSRIDAMELSRRSGAGFSTLRRLQFLATRRRTDDEQLGERISVADRPAVDLPQGAVRGWELTPDSGNAPGSPETKTDGLLDEGAGGPFAGF